MSQPSPDPQLGTQEAHRAMMAQCGIHVSKRRAERVTRAIGRECMPHPTVRPEIDLSDLESRWLSEVRV